MLSRRLLFALILAGVLSPHSLLGGDKVPRRLDFAADVVPILSKHGCNASACHGKAEGQNGFKLSVFGFDPPADHAALTRQGRGRRVFPAAPDQSLLLSKASGRVPHGGGARIPVGSRAYQVLRQWIAQGAASTGETSPLLRIEVSPRRRVMPTRGLQPLRVAAFYGDGSEVDVTDLARFDTNNPALATVDASGRVTVGESPGQAAIMVSFRGRVDRFEALIPRQGPPLEPQAPESNPIDRAIQQRLRQLRIAPAPLADDASFLRRATLDILGRLPTAEEARHFLRDNASDKRARLVDHLLQQPEYADYWALKWADLLRVDRRALGHKDAYAYYRWIHQQFASNRPFDDFARDLITAAGPLRDRPAGHFYSVVKSPGERASTLSQVFLGVRIACAQCHHHPFDRWSQTDYLGFSSYFAPLKRGASIRGPAIFAANSVAQLKHPRTGKQVPAHPLGHSLAEGNREVSRGDLRSELADWMTRPDNPWFARAAANRYWAHFFGRGVVEPVDDLRDTNPPSNPELLDVLAEKLIAADFDLKQLIREITTTKAYQRSTAVNATNERDEQNYSRKLLKRLEAEVLFDAVVQVTGVEEKFDGAPYGYRAVQLWDSETKHEFLAQFGRPQRKTACSCERMTTPNVGQVLHLLNSPELSAKITDAKGHVAQWCERLENDKALIEELYLTMYARRPVEDEMQTALAHLSETRGSRRENAEDLMWALMNSLEFVFNH